MLQDLSIWMPSALAMVAVAGFILAVAHVQSQPNSGLLIMPAVVHTSMDQG
jgi:hypothetical protein